MKGSNSRTSDTWKQFTVKAIHDGKEVVASGFASWKYDAIGLFLSVNPDICFKEIIEIKEEVQNK